MSTITREEERALLEENLTQHKRTLANLELKAAMYSPLERPVSLLSEIDAEKKEIQDIEEKLQQLNEAIEAEAQERRQLAALYSRGMARFHSGDWAQAIHLFQQILDVDRDYRDTLQRLIQAKKQEYLEQLYAGAKQAEADEDWQMVITVCQEIIDIAPFYHDVQWSLWKARLYSMRQRGEKAIANIKTKPAGLLIEEEQKPVKRRKGPSRKDATVTITMWWTSLESEDKVKIVVALIGLLSVVFSVLFTPLVGKVVDILFPLSTPIPVAIASPTLTATPTATSTPAHTATSMPSEEVLIEIDGAVIDASDDHCREIICNSSPRIQVAVLDSAGVPLQPDIFSYNWRFNPPDPYNRDKLDSKNYAIIYSVPCDRNNQMVTIEVLKDGETLCVRRICFNIKKQL